MLTPTTLASLQARYVPADAWPGVLDGTPLRAVWHTPPRYGIPERPRDGTEVIVTGAPVPRGETGALWAPYLLPGSWGEDWAPLTCLHLPLTRPEARHRLAVVCAAGVRCPKWVSASFGACGYVGDGDVGFVRYRNGCPTCRGTGYLLPPAPAWHLLPRAEVGDAGHDYGDEVAAVLLGCHVARVLAGVGGVRGVLGRWEGSYMRESVAGIKADSFVVGSGWGFRTVNLHASPANGTRGPETGLEGMAKADAAALEAGLALVDPAAPGGVRVGWPEASAEGPHGR
jgi:hypothetical protein